MDTFFYLYQQYQTAHSVSCLYKNNLPNFQKALKNKTEEIPSFSFTKKKPFHMPNCKWRREMYLWGDLGQGNLSKQVLGSW